MQPHAASMYLKNNQFPIVRNSFRLLGKGWVFGGKDAQFVHNSPQSARPSGQSRLQVWSGMTGVTTMKPTSSATLALILAAVLFTAGCGGPGGDPPKSQGTAPAIASISPISGSPGGGTNVAITGTGFQSGARVIFGGVDATNVAVVSGGQITCSTPAHAAGAVTVEVRNPRNGGSTSMTNGFNYEGLSLTSISPASGTIRGGTTVTLNGTRFDSSTAVTFGGVAATAKTLISSTQMTAVTPATATAGAVNVQVRSSDGQTSSLTSAFNYLALTVTSLSVTSGPSSGGTGVTVLGSEFQPGATVRFGGTSAAVTFKSSTELQTVTPAHTSGIVDVVVTNPSPDSQAATRSGAFTFANAVTITSVSPANGPPTGGTAVTIAGAAFVSGATVQFGGVAAPTVNVVNSSTINATTPSGSGTVNLTVINPGNDSATLTGGFTFDPPKTQSVAPVIASVEPSSGGISGGTAVMLTGTNFQTGATVRFGTQLATTVSVISGGQISAVSPAGVAGPVDIRVTNPDSLFDDAPAAFTYTGITITNVSPNVGSTLGGTVVTITGSEFNSGTQVFFGGSAGTGVTLLSNLQLTVTAPARTSGIVDVEVRNLSQSAFLVGGFTYEPPPTVTSISREIGIATGGTKVVIRGTGFLSGVTALFGGTVSTGVVFVNSNEFSIRTPAKAPGFVDIVVRNPDGGEFRMVNAFEYHPAPTITYVTQGFEGGTLGRFRGDFTTGCIRPESTTEAAFAGARGAKCEGTCFISRLEYIWCSSSTIFQSSGQPCNPALVDPNGLYQRFYIMMPQPTIDAVVATEQLKIILNRRDVSLGTATRAWFQGGFGLEFGSNPRNELRIFEDSAFDAGTNGPTNFLFQGGVWYEFVTHFKRDGATNRGTARLWIDGKLRKKLTSLAGLGSSDPTNQQAFWVGQVVLETGGLFAGLVYLDEVAAANGMIEPVQ